MRAVRAHDPDFQQSKIAWKHEQLYDKPPPIQADDGNATDDNGGKTVEKKTSKVSPAKVAMD